MYSQRKGAILKEAYKEAFESSFVEEYTEWKSTLANVNDSINVINEKRKKDYKTLDYDEFCCLSKVIVTKHLDRVNWTSVLKKESAASKKDASPTGSSNRISLHIKKLEMKILCECFREAIKKSVGPTTYSKYKNEINITLQS